MLIPNDKAMCTCGHPADHHFGDIRFDQWGNIEIRSYRAICIKKMCKCSEFIPDWDTAWAKEEP